MTSTQTPRPKRQTPAREARLAMTSTAGNPEYAAESTTGWWRLLWQAVTARLSTPTSTGRTRQRRRAARYPVSRWYLRPGALWLARRLWHTAISPSHLSWLGLAVALVGLGLLAWNPGWHAPAGCLLLLAWFFDRADGLLARLQRSASHFGAWLDANLDELVDLATQVTMAWSAARLGSTWAWPALVAFLFGKYLLMYGLLVEPRAGRGGRKNAPPRELAPRSPLRRLLHALYHLPANADVRVHLAVLALWTGCLTAELVLVAIYYNLRWIVRYQLVWQRQREAAL